METDINEYRIVCKNLGIIPCSEILESLYCNHTNLTISSPTFNELSQENLHAIFHLLDPKFTLLTDLCISTQIFNSNTLKVLASYLTSNETLKKLVLNSNQISDKESLNHLCLSLSNVEYLDLSSNLISDDSVPALCNLIENSKLKVLILDNNNITKGAFASALANNESIQCLSVSGNPLSFDTILALFEMLTINRTLKSLLVKDVELKGPAPLKENPSGHLTKNECIILKLAYVLRYSMINYISFDVDGSCTAQLDEVEKSLTKYNKTLLSLSSKHID